MNIVKYKKINSSEYRLILDNGQTIDLYEDTILKYDLLLKKQIDEQILNQLIKYNEKYKSYYESLKYLKIRIRSKKEIKQFLQKKNYSVDIINQTISKLEQHGYLNDMNFAKSFLTNKLITTSAGPMKIRKELKEHELSKEDIDKVLKDYTEDIQLEKIKKHISRVIKSNRNKGNVYLKRKIYIDLNNEGFSPKLIETELSNLILEDDQDLAKKEYEKLYKKLSKKYSGEELVFKINQKLYQKGFHYDK